MNKILKERVLLIRSLIKSVYELKCESLEKEILFGIINEIRQDRKNHFLSISQDVISKISYAAILEHKYDSFKRRRCTLGRYIMRNFEFDKSILKEHLINTLVSKTFGNLYYKLDMFKILKGQEIFERYQSLGDESCMTGEYANLVQLYVINPDKVSMVVSDKVRALLWKTDEGVTVLDRIYPSGHHQNEILRKWAKAKGFVIRKNNGCHHWEDDKVYLDDSKTYNITLQHQNLFPYLDTFCYGNINKNEVILTNCKENQEFAFQDQNGDYFCIDTDTDDG